jgi:hypothetical protein
MGLQKFSTQMIENNPNPKWNTSMQFQIYDLNKDLLNIGVFSQKHYTPNRSHGVVTMKLSDVYAEQMKDGGNPISRSFKLSNARNGLVTIKMNVIAYS